MTLNEAITQHGPSWLSIWLPILVAGAFVLPLLLLIWRSTRFTAVVCVAASVLGAVGVNMLYNQLGYVKLLGLPHIIVWTPVVIYLWFKMKSPMVDNAARIIMGLILTTIAISLAFDYFDSIQYLLGDRTPLT